MSYRNDRTDRPRTHGRVLEWEETEARAERAMKSLEAVLLLLDAHDDGAAFDLLKSTAERILYREEA